MAELTRGVLADHLRAASNDAYAMEGLGYHRLSLILDALSTAVETEDDAVIDRWTFMALRLLIREKEEINDRT